MITNRLITASVSSVPGFKNSGVTGLSAANTQPTGLIANPLATSDVTYMEYTYGDTSGSLTIGQPVYIDVTDAGEYNSFFSAGTTINTAVTPATIATAKTVVLGTNAKASNLVFAGVYQPSNASDSPNTGDTIRVLVRGCGVVRVTTGATTGALVGGLLSTAATANANGTTVAAYAAGVTFGVVLATRAATTVGATAVAISTTAYVNAYIMGLL